MSRVAIAFHVLVALLLVSTACLSSSSLLTTASATVPDGKGWIATWTASPAGQSPDTAQLQQATVREIVHVSSGGEVIRIRLSNAFGAQPLVIASAHAALRESGAQIVPGTDRQLTFSGEKLVIVAPGETVVSDGVALSVPALADLAVSLYVAGTTAQGTAHPFALQTSYLGAGDQTSVEDMKVSGTISSWPFLTGVELADSATQPGATIVAFGDSLTNGANSSPDSNRRWIDHLASRLTSQSVPTTIVNAGISGNRLLHDGTGGVASMYGRSGVSRFETDALSVPGAKTVIVLLGINDIVQPGSYLPTADVVSAAQITTGLRELADLAHARSLKIFFGTLMPFAGPNSAYFSPEKDAKRQAVNQWIRSQTASDGIIDFDLALRDPTQPNRLLPLYDSGDHLHPNDAGHQAMADAVDLSLLQN